MVHPTRTALSQNCCNSTRGLVWAWKFQGIIRHATELTRRRVAVLLIQCWHIVFKELQSRNSNFPANTRHWHTVDLLLAQRVWRWPSIKSTLGQRFAFAGRCANRRPNSTGACNRSGHYVIVEGTPDMTSSNNITSWWLRSADPAAVPSIRWFNAALMSATARNACPASKQHWGTSWIQLTAPWPFAYRRLLIDTQHVLNDGSGKIKTACVGLTRLFLVLFIPNF